MSSPDTVGALDHLIDAPVRLSTPIGRASRIQAALKMMSSLDVVDGEAVETSRPPLLAGGQNRQVQCTSCPGTLARVARPPDGRECSPR